MTKILAKRHRQGDWKEAASRRASVSKRYMNESETMRYYNNTYEWIWNDAILQWQWVQLPSKSYSTCLATTFHNWVWSQSDWDCDWDCDWDEMVPEPPSVWMSLMIQRVCFLSSSSRWNGRASPFVRQAEKLICYALVKTTKWKMAEHFSLPMRWIGRNFASVIQTGKFSVICRWTREEIDIFKDNLWAQTSDRQGPWVSNSSSNSLRKTIA